MHLLSLLLIHHAICTDPVLDAGSSPRRNLITSVTKQVMRTNRRLKWLESLGVPHLEDQPEYYIAMKEAVSEGDLHLVQDYVDFRYPKDGSMALLSPIIKDHGAKLYGHLSIGLQGEIGQLDFSDSALYIFLAPLLGTKEAERTDPPVLNVKEENFRFKLLSFMHLFPRKNPVEYFRGKLNSYLVLYEIFKASCDHKFDANGWITHQPQSYQLLWKSLIAQPDDHVLTEFAKLFQGNLFGEGMDYAKGKPLHLPSIDFLHVLMDRWPQWVKKDSIPLRAWYRLALQYPQYAGDVPLGAEFPLLHVYYPAYPVSLAPLFERIYLHYGKEEVEQQVTSPHLSTLFKIIGKDINDAETLKQQFYLSPMTFEDKADWIEYCRAHNN